MKYKVIRQHDEKDCGAACLATIANFYGYKTDFHNFIRLTDTDKDGTNMNSLVEAAKKLKFEAEGLEGSVHELIEGIRNGEICFPFIAHFIKENETLHFAVVFEMNETTCVIGDPALGLVKLTVQEFEKIWTGAIISLKKTKDFKKGNYARSKKKMLKSIFMSNKRTLATVISLSILTVLFGILGTFVFQTTIDGFSAQVRNDSEVHGHNSVIEEEQCDDVECDKEHGGEIQARNNVEKVLVNIIEVVNDFAELINVKSFNMIFILLMILYFICSCVHYLRGKLLVYIAKNVDSYLGETYYNHVVDLTVTSATEKKTGEFLTRFSDLSTIRNAISGATVAIVLDALMVVFCGMVLYLYNKTLFLISLSLIIFYTIVALVFRKPLEKNNQKTMEANAVFESYFKESIDGKELIKSTCSQNQVKQKLHNYFQKFLDAMVRNRKTELVQEAISNAIESIGMVVILWVGFWFVKSEVLSLGALITFYMLKGYFTEPIKNIISLQPMIQTAFVAIERLFDVLDMETENNIKTVETNCISKWQNLTIDHISFEYRNRDNILDDMSLEIKKGEKIALVGESGCGKTTLAKLLMGFYEPTSGNIYMDGVSYQCITKNEIRMKIAYISQDMFFFTDSVRNNLTFGNHDITDEEILQICKLCRVYDFINDLPFGLDTPIDENGVNLSAGQKQRLALVRALLRKPQILIMDEITSNLDTITERAIRDFIFNCKEMTCIMIAHRLSTIKHCDCIYVLQHGKVAECGTHDVLANKKGLYYDMLLAQ